MMNRKMEWGVGAILLAVLLLGTTGLVCSTLDSVKFQKAADEGFYLVYASRVAREGPAGFPGLFTDYLRHLDANRYFPAPLRLLTIALGAIAVGWGGVPDFHSLVFLSLAAFIVLLMVMFWGTQRAFGRQAAWWTTLLACAAPLHLAFSRRALSDTLVSAFILVSLWLFLRAIWRTEEETPAGRWGWVAVSYTAAFLVKESAILLVPVSLFFLGWRRLRTGRPASLWPVCAVSVVPASAAGAMMVLAAGGIGRFLRTAAAFSGAAALNSYALRYQQGPWFRFIVDLMLISPLPVLLYLMWLGMLIQKRSRDEKDWFWALVPVLFVAMVSLVPAGKNVRFVIFLEMPMRLCAVLLLQRLTGGSVIRMGAAVLVLMGFDLQTFYRFFVNGGIYDPLSFYLLLARRFLPPP